MSLALYDVNGLVEDLGSAVGYSSFIEWAVTLNKSVITSFYEKGCTEDMAGLVKALNSAKAPDPYDEETRAVVVAAAKKAEGILIVSDGESEIDPDPQQASPARPRTHKEARRLPPKARRRLPPKAPKRKHIR